MSRRQNHSNTSFKSTKQRQSLPSEYEPFSKPEEWSKYCDQITASQLKNTSTKPQYWLSQREKLHKSLRNLKVSQQFAVIQKMNITSFGNIAAVCIRCRFPSVKRLYQQTFRRLLGLLFMMIEFVRNHIEKPVLLRMYGFDGPVKKLLALPTKLQKDKQITLTKVRKTCNTILKWSVSSDK